MIAGLSHRVGVPSALEAQQPEALDDRRRPRGRERLRHRGLRDPLGARELALRRAEAAAVGQSPGALAHRPDELVAREQVGVRHPRLALGRRTLVRCGDDPGSRARHRALLQRVHLVDRLARRPPRRPLRDVAGGGRDRGDRSDPDAEPALDPVGKGELQEQERPQRRVEGRILRLLLIADGRPQRAVRERKVVLDAGDRVVQRALGCRPVGQPTGPDDVRGHDDGHGISLALIFVEL